MQADLRLEGGRLVVRCRYSETLVGRFKGVPTRRFHPDTKEWSFAAVKDVVLMVLDACGQIPEMLPADLRALLGEQGYAAPVSKPVDLSLIDGHPFKTPPYGHQKVNLARLMQYDRWLIADEQGAGKTYVVCNALFRLSQARALVLCPKSVCDVWKDELQKHAGLESSVIDGSKTWCRSLLGHAEPKIKIANYEKLLHSLADYNTRQWDVLVLDEVHRCKNLGSLTCKAVVGISERTPFVWALSGTPAPNGLEDWAGVLEAVAPGLLPCKGAKGRVTKTAFEERYCIKERVGQSSVFAVSGYRNVAELHAFVASVTSRYAKDECLDLPPKVYSSRTVRLEGEQARVYKELKKDAVARLKGLKKEGTLSARNILTESLRLLQVVGGFVPDDDGTMHEFKTKAKNALLSDVVDEIGHRQCVVWCVFREEVEWLRKRLGTKDGDVLTLTGDTPAAERAENVRRFQRGDAQFFVGTAAAGGTGITLHAADTEIFYSRDYNLVNYLQAADRCHRIGQKNTVSIIKLIAANTVEVKIDETLDKKQDLMTMLLQKPEDYL